MSSNSCVVLHVSSKAMHRMNQEENQRVHSSSEDSKDDSNSREHSGSNCLTPTDDDINVAAHKSLSSTYRSNNPGGESDSSNDDSPPRPQHELLDHTDLEAVIRFQRNRRLLLARLQDAAPRGKLSLINLSGRNLGPEDAPLLKEVIGTNPFLSVLKLCYNSLGDQGAAILSEALILRDDVHHNLSVLDLGFNDIGNVGCDAIAIRGLAGNYNLKSLYLSGNRISEKGALSLAAAILHGTGLTALHLVANPVGCTGIKAISGAIAENDARRSLTEMATFKGQIEHLHLGSTLIDLEGFIAIPQMLLSNTSLRSLCMSNSNIDDQGMALLSQAFSQNKKVPLESLLLSFNQITCQGVECLMNALWGSTTLRELRLDNNKIQDRGAQLCAVVLTSIALQKLDISFNRITTVGIKALMKNLSENDSLRTLVLCGIPIDQNASKAVSYALAYNNSLRSLYLDSCYTGYSSQRHIVAGIVSNRRLSLRLLTGFQLRPIASTLGMPNLPESWSNDQVLGFIRLMWQQWLLKSGRGSSPQDFESFRGPAPPAAVAAAAKIALSSLGASPGSMFHREDHERSDADASPIDPARTSLLERSDSGMMSIPTFSDALDEDISDWCETMSKPSPTPSKSLSVSAVHGPLEMPERRNKNLQWLRTHFRSLNEIGKLPLNNADLWQLHQYYFSPPACPDEDTDNALRDHSDTDGVGVSVNDSVTSAPPIHALHSASSAMGRAVSYQVLEDAFATSGKLARFGNSHKRRSDDGMTKDDEEPATKRVKGLSKPRIAYYPRVMAKIQSLGTKPMEQSLSLLRQLKYAENVVFAGRDPYSDVKEEPSDDLSHADVEMILLDLL